MKSVEHLKGTAIFWLLPVYSRLYYLNLAPVLCRMPFLMQPSHQWLGWFPAQKPSLDHGGESARSCHWNLRGQQNIQSIFLKQKKCTFTAFGRCLYLEQFTFISFIP